MQGLPPVKIQMAFVQQTSYVADAFPIAQPTASNLHYKTFKTRQKELAETNRNTGKSSLSSNVTLQ